jgi:hypothetical protein
MKRSGAIAFLLLFAAIVSAAPAEGQDDKAPVTETFKGYARAWDNLDWPRILPYHHEPLILITAEGVRSMATRADIEAWVKAILGAHKGTRLRASRVLSATRQAGQCRGGGGQRPLCAV